MTSMPIATSFQNKPSNLQAFQFASCPTCIIGFGDNCKIGTVELCIAERLALIFGAALFRNALIETCDAFAESSKEGFALLDNHSGRAWQARDFAELVALVDFYLDKRFRLNIPEGLASVHCCALELNGSAVVFVGESGAGKTTFSLSAMASGIPLLGDEYGLVDFVNCRYAQISSPVCLKAGGRECLGEFATRIPSGYFAKSVRGLTYELISMSDLHNAMRFEGSAKISGFAPTMCGARGPSLPLKAVITLSRGSEAASLRPSLVQQWPRAYLPSFDWESSRFNLFKGLLGMGSKGVCYLELSYVNALDAVEMLKRNLFHWVM